MSEVNESFQIWELKEGFREWMELSLLVENDEYLSLYFEGESSYVCVRFSRFSAYRKVDESYRLRMLSASGGFSTTFNKVDNSLLLDWISDENFKMYDNEHLFHYLFVTEFECLDVVSGMDPEILWLDEKYFNGVMELIKRTESNNI